jgi:hypothetical protein
VVSGSREHVKGERVAGEPVPEKVPLELRVAHLLRINSYLDMAILSMWAQRRPQVIMGMAEASARRAGPAGASGTDEELLVKVRALIREAREYYAADDFPAAMARMRVAHDLVGLHIIRISGE